MTAPPYPVPDKLEGTQACAGEDTDTFFPDPGTNGRALDEIKAICRRCPFEHACLEYAMAQPSLYGVWGGMTWNERTMIRRRKLRAS